MTLGRAAHGIAAMALASCIWGTAAIYFKLVAHVQPLEMLAHRTLWSAVFMALILGVQGRLGAVRALLSDRAERRRAMGAAAFLTVNFGLFIWAVQVGRAVESGLGYYIFPLFAVALGALVQGERHSAPKWVAVGLAALAVGVLTWGLGVVPWVSVLLAASFSFYGLIKSRMKAGAVVSVAAEVWLLMPLTLLFLGGAHLAGWEVRLGAGAGAEVAVFGRGWGESLLLMCAGPVTALPILLFSYATQRSGYAALGLVQYINPTLQVLVAALLFGEVFTGWHAIALALIWLALALYSLESFRQGRAARRAGPRAAASGTTPT
jgi:chloramphenicol-sensitive protein RarD